MADPSETAAPAAPAPSPLAPAAPAGSTADIVGMLSRKREAATTPAAPEAADSSAGTQAPSQEAETEPESPPAPGETETEDEAGEPPIEPPRTWTKAEKEAFAALPREHQQAVADRERERDAHYQRGLQDAAEKSRAAQAREQAAEQARQQYETALPTLLQQFQAQVAIEFQDIKTWDDVSEMQRTDPIRFQQWQIAVDKSKALTAEVEKAEKRRREEFGQKYTAWQEEQQTLFQKAAPEYFDQEKAPKLWAELRTGMKDAGITDQEIDALWSGGNMPFHDHRTQLLLRDAMRYRAAQKALKNAAPKSVPPVQRPGTGSQKSEAATAQIRELTEKVRKSGAPRDIAALLAARRKAAS